MAARVASRRLFVRGCLVGLVIIILPYIVNAAVILVPYYASQRRWQSLGWTGYTLTVRQTAFSPIQGVSVVTVERGTVVVARSDLCPQCPLSTYQEVTVEAMFHYAPVCAILFPLLTCSIEYQPDLGHPTHVRVSCPIPDACFNELWVEQLAPDV
jgi:hypothetical protein